MKRKFFIGILVFVLLATLSLSACNTIISSTTEKTQVTTLSTSIPANISTSSASQVNWWDKFGKPQYGGTITFATGGLMGFSLDPYVMPGADHDFWYDTLFEPDWTLSRDTWSFNTMVVPDQYWKGNLYESWDMTDALTITCHVRQGVTWQDKAPVKGREFTAYDIQSHYDRILGKGDGYTEVDQFFAGSTGTWDTVTATDKYTIVYKFKKASAQNFASINDRFALSQIEAPEWAALDETSRGDWKNVVGTGPWMLDNYVDGNAITFVKNPNYWGHDPRYTDNQLPYADKLVMLIIPDANTKLAALRTGQLDTLNSMDSLTWQQNATITKTNSDLQHAKVPQGSTGIAFRIDKTPFTDIRVRQALNMSIDRAAIAGSIYGGTADTNPSSFLSKELKGYAYVYEDWPQSLKDTYSYNPTQAKQLLAEAGFSKGFDTDVMMASGDTNLMQTFKSFFADIDVNMEIKTFDATTWESVKRNAKTDQMLAENGAFAMPLTMVVSYFYSKQQNAAMYGVNDPGYDALYERFYAAKDAASADQAAQGIDKYVTEHFWLCQGPEYYQYNVWQPWLKGYSGEGMMWGAGMTWAKLWTTKK